MAKNSHHSLISDDGTKFHLENFGRLKSAPKHRGNGVTKHHQPSPEEIRQADALRDQLDPSKNPALSSAYRKALE